MQIKLFNTKKNFKKTNFYFNSDLYWGLILGVVFILALASFAFGYYLFMQISKDPAIQVTSLDEKQTVKKERLEKASEYFSGREEKSIEILKTPSPVVDPSL